MKLATISLTLLLSLASAFRPVQVSRSSTTWLSMFEGAGGGQDADEVAKMEQAAKSMGMSLDEYKLGMQARNRLTATLDGTRLTAQATGVQVARDGNNPPKMLEITISEAGKALGKEKLSSELVAALKSSADASRTARTDAQKEMMAYIGEEMKKVGK